MSLTDYTIVLFILLFLMYGIYDELIMPRRKGKTHLSVNLKRRNKLDSMIFVGLVGILIWQNIANHGSPLTTTLLLVLAFMAIWMFWIRLPKMVFKPEGFFYANVFIPYQRIKNIRLSEDGILVIDLEHRQLLIHVCELDDLERIYKLMLAQP